VKGRSSSYYVKLVLFCFAITSLPVIILGIVSYGHSSGVVQNNVNAQKSLSLTQMEANVEQLLKTVDQSATHFLSSHIVQSAIHEPLNPKQFPLFNQLKSELNYLQRLDTGITDITMLSQTGSWLMNNSGLYPLDEVPEPAFFLALLDPPSPSMPLWTVRSSTEAEGAQQSGKLVTAGSAAANECAKDIQLIKKLPLTAFNPVGAAVITIPACSLSDNITLDSGHESFLILDKNKETIWAQGLAIQDPSPLRGKLAQAGAPEGQLSLTLDTQDYTLTYRESDYTGWTYVSAVPLAQLTKQSRGIGWYTLFICLALLLLFIFLSWILSRRMYRPIVSLYQDIIAEQDEPVQGKRVDELRVIGEQVHTLFRTQREMKDRMKGQLEQLKTFFMIKLVLGGMKEEDIAANLDQFDMRNDWRHFAVMAAQIELENTRFEQKDYDLLMFAVHNMLGELIPEANRLQPVLLGRSQITVVTSREDADGAFRRELFALAKHVQDKVAQVLGVSVYVGISLTYGRLRDIPRAYEESVEALQSRARFGGPAIMDFADLGQNHTMNYSYPVHLQQELFDAIKLTDREQTEHFLHQLIDEICRSSANAHDRQFNAIRLLMNLMNLAHSFDIESQLMSNQQILFDELFQLDIPRDGEQWIRKKLIEPVLSGIAERTEMRHLHISRELMQIIHDEFETDLSIEICAERLHYNPSYLSTVFRKSMNIPFSTCLAQYRHQMAKKWLVETELSVKDISERLRYNNSQNFIRSFRKLEGLPPGKYRDLHPGGGGIGSGGQRLEKEG
jgi:AraC-like DNA-binding protein